MAPPDGFSHIPNVVHKVVQELTTMSFITEHLTTAFQEESDVAAIPLSRNFDAALMDVDVNSVATNDVDMAGDINLGRLVMTYMGVCRLNRPGARYRRIDIKVSFFHCSSLCLCLIDFYSIILVSCLHLLSCILPVRTILIGLCAIMPPRSAIHSTIR